MSRDIGVWGIFKHGFGVLFCGLRIEYCLEKLLKRKPDELINIIKYSNNFGINVVKERQNIVDIKTLSH